MSLQSPHLVPGSRAASVLGQPRDISSRLTSRATSRAPSREPRDVSRITSRAPSRASSVLDSLLEQPYHRASSPSGLRGRNKRWSSALEYRKEPSCVPSLPCPGLPRPPLPPPRANRAQGAYTDALIKSSRRLRERSMSPAAPPVLVQPPASPYKTNLDYYRGKTKSIYEKEPMFKDFVRNIPLSQANPYDNTNLTSLKKDFQVMLKDKYPMNPSGPTDPYSPSAGKELFHRPMSGVLARRHAAHPPTPCILPTITVYHRNTRGY